MRPTLLLLLLPAGALAQEPGPAPGALRPPVAALSDPFGRIGSIRELSDGRVLVADNSSDSRLVLADLKSGSVRSIGRPGQGPQEYFLPARRLIRLRGDSTLFISGSRPTRWLVMLRDSIVATVPADNRAFLRANDPWSGDSAGSVLARVQLPGTRMAPSRVRSEYAVIRVDRATGRVDTIGRLMGEMTETTESVRNGRPFYNFFQHVYSQAEQAVLAPDGWVAFIRLAPYRVEWLPPRAPLVRGAEIPHAVVRIDEREKKAYLARASRTVGQPVTGEGYQWAETVSPIWTSAMATSDGKLLIRRAPWSGAEDTNYDLVDRRGQLVARIRLPASERIVGFGNGAVYVAVADDDGLETLRKHPWP